MYKAIIADDEKKVCQLIQVMGDWEALGIEIVDICHSGDDVWESIQKYEPDIVLTDIRMPVYDGLQIINKVNERYGMSRNICFIIISGYAEFEYARQAIQYNIVNYLLKPLDRNQLNEALRKACNSLSMKQQQAENEQKLKENKRFLQASCIDALQESRGQEALTVEELNRRYCLSFREGYFQGMFFNFPFSISENENLFIKTFTEKMEVHFHFCHEIVLKPEGTGIYLVLNYAPEVMDMLSDSIQEFYRDIEKVAQKYGEFQICLGIGRSVTSPGDIRQSLAEAESAELSRLLYEDKHLISYERLPGQIFGLYQLVPTAKFQELEQTLGRFNAFETKKWFSEVSVLVERDREKIKNAVILMDLSRVISGILKKSLEEVDEELVNKSLKDLQISLKQASTLSNYMWILKTKAGLLVERLSEILSEKESRPIQEAKQYVQQNFAEAITLSDVAERLNFSSAYFGAMFKKHTGKAFTAYLTDVRIEQAKKLLKTSDYTVAQIAGMVGYQDVKYFSKTFKTVCGMKPTEYKKMVAPLYSRKLNI